MTRSLRVTVGAMLAVLVVLVVLAAWPASAWAASSGVATITKPGQTTPLNGGVSSTLYGSVLPSGASCPGDTAHDGYLVYSYLVPEGTSPTAVNFKKGVPSRYYGYISDGDYFGAVNTQIGTGQINPLPTFNWMRLTPHDLFPNGQHRATWEGGIACAPLSGVVSSYWNSQVVFTADAADPGGFTWKVEQIAAASSDTGLWIGIGVAVVVLAAVVVVVLRRRRSKPKSDAPADDDANNESEQLTGTVR